MRNLTTLKDGDSKANIGGVGQSKKHESAPRHVSGEAVYIDDRPVFSGQLHAAVGQSAHAHAKIKSMDLSAVKAAPGVVAVITSEDVPGHVDIGPVFPGDPVLTEGTVEFVGQPLFAVAATSHDLARKAVKLAKVDYEVLEPVLSVKDALAKQHFVRPPFTMARGDADKAISEAPHQLKGEQFVGGQEHMYLEGQGFQRPAYRRRRHVDPHFLPAPQRSAKAGGRGVECAIQSGGR